MVWVLHNCDVYMSETSEGEITHLSSMRPKALGNDMVGPNVTDTVDSHLHNVVYKALIIQTLLPFRL